jgi:excinuclease ABC subunit C
MDSDSTDSPKVPASPVAQHAGKPARPQPDLPPQDTSADIDPAMVATDEDEEARLPEVPEERTRRYRKVR